jgi:hypothetical protein
MVALPPRPSLSFSPSTNLFLFFLVSFLSFFFFAFFLYSSCFFPAPDRLGEHAQTKVHTAKTSKP